MIMKIQIIKENVKEIIKIIDRTSKKDLVFKNETKFRLHMFQKGFKDSYNKTISRDEEIEFGFENPYERASVEMEIILESGEILEGCYKVDLFSQEKNIQKFKSRAKRTIKIA